MSSFKAAKQQSSVSFDSNTLLVPLVSVGNGAQLAADLLIATYGLELQGRFILAIAEPGEADLTRFVLQEVCPPGIMCRSQASARMALASLHRLKVSKPISG